jgi:hypothetical protein
MHKWFKTILSALLKRKVHLKFLLASLQTLTNSKDSVTRDKSNFGFGIPSLSLHNIHDQFSDHRRLSEQTFKVTGCYWKAGTSFLTRVTFTGRIFTLSKLFHRSKQKLYFGCSSQKTVKKR